MAKGANERKQLAEVALCSGLFADCCWSVFDADGAEEHGCVGNAPWNAWYDIASLTKIFTTTAALAVMQERGLSLDCRLSDMPGNISGALPSGSNVVARERLESMTMRRLLTHTSGLAAWYPFYADGRPFWEIMSEFLERPPLQKMVYSDLNFMLIRELLCHITGFHFERVIQRYVNERTGLDSVSFTPPAEAYVAPGCLDNQIEEKMCAQQGICFGGFRPHRKVVCGQANDGNAFYYFRGVSGHAGLFGNVDALAGLGRFYLMGNEWFRQALAPQPGCAGRCLGFHTGSPFPTGCGHTGFTGTSLWLDGVRGFGMAILSNRLMCGGASAPDLTEFRMKMHETMLD